MTLVESLKKFLAKLGGDPTELDNNATSAEVIDAISEAYTDKEGTHVEVTPTVTKGTKIATITTNNTPHDIYVPTEKYELPFSVGDLIYDAENQEYSASATLMGTEERILEILSTHTKDTIKFSSGVSGGDPVEIDMYSIYHKKETDRWMITIRLKQHISNEYFEGDAEYYFSWTKTNGAWDKPVGSGTVDIDSSAVDRMLLTIDSNRKLIYHWPFKSYNNTRALTYADLSESMLGHLAINKGNVIVRDESGYMGSSSSQRPNSYLASFCAYGGSYGKNYDYAAFIAFKHLYQQGSSSDIILKEWYYRAASTTLEHTDIVLTRVENS